MVLYAGFTAYSGGQAVLDACLSLSGRVWLAILALSLGNYLLRYWRWHLYIGHKQTLSIGHLQHLAIYIAGFSLTMTPGKAGEAMRSLYLKKQGVSHQRSLGALFVERIMDLLAILLLAALGLSFLDGNQVTAAVIVTVALIVACLVAVKMPKAWFLGLGIVKKSPLKIQRGLAFVDEILTSADDLLSLKFLVIGLGLGVMAWALEGYGLFLVMQDFQWNQSDVFIAIAIYAVAVLLGAISFLPGGLGGTEAAMLLLLITVGFDAPTATAMTFICRVATLWFAVILGLLTLLLLSCLGLSPTANEIKEI